MAATAIPGVIASGSVVRCAPDAAAAVARALGLPPPAVSFTVTADHVQSLPGLARFRELKLQDILRPYQKVGALFLATRAWALNCDPMRLGKSLQALAAAVLVGARRILIVCPAASKLAWAEEAHKWLAQEALLLEGRAGWVARQFCSTCAGRGVDSRGVWCSACRLRNGTANGYRTYDVLRLVAREESWLEGLNERSRRRRRVSWCPLPARFYCRRHSDVEHGGVEHHNEPCAACLTELRDRLATAPVVVVNYDILGPHLSGDAAGRVYQRDGLQGWLAHLSQLQFDVAILDEAHKLRGYATDPERRRLSRRVLTRRLVERIPRVWGLTGTPVYCHTRDLWGPLDVVSGGLWGGWGKDPRPRQFHVRYCEGHQGEYGWVADGCSIYAHTELTERLRYVIIQRTRTECVKDMPRKTRQVVSVDAPPEWRPLRCVSRAPDTLQRAILKASDAKRATVVDAVLSEMAEGAKTIVYVFRRKSAVLMGQAIAEATKKKEYRGRMRQVDFQIWVVHGDTSTAVRHKQAAAFRAHDGAAVFVSTINAMEATTDLSGAYTVHFADMCWAPAAMFQAEDRPNAVRSSKGLTIIYYILKAPGSPDVHMLDLVIPKVEAMDKVVGGEAAGELLKAFGKTEVETREEIWARLTAHLAAEEVAA